MVESTVSYKPLTDGIPKKSHLILQGNYEEPVSGKIFESFEFGNSTKTLNQEIDELVLYLYEFKPSVIGTPFQGTSFQITLDASKVYFGSREGKIGIAKLETKETIAEVDLKEREIWTLALVDNDTYLFSGGAGGLIKKFLVKDLTQVASFEGHENEVNVIKISNDQQTMYSAGDDGLLIAWDLAEPNPKPQILVNYQDNFLGMDLTQDNHYVAVVGRYASLHVFDLKTQSLYKFLNDPECFSLWSVSILSEKNLIALGNSYGKIFLFNFSTWEKVKVLDNHTDVLRSLVSTKDGRFLASGSYDKNIMIWDLEGNRNPVKLVGHEDNVKTMEIIESEGLIVSMSDDRTIRAWKIPKFEFYSKVYFENIDSQPLTNFLACSSDPNVVFMQRTNSLIRLDLATSETKSLLFDDYGSPILAYNGVVNSFLVTFSIPIYTALDIDLNEFEITEYDGNSLSPVRTDKVSLHGVYFLGFTQDCKTVLIGEFHRVTLMNYSDFTVIHTFLSHKSFVTSVVTTNDSLLMFSVDQEGEVKSYDLVSKCEIKALSDKQPTRVTSILVSPSNDYLLLFDSNKQLSIWNIMKLIKVHSLELPDATQMFFSQNSSNLHIIQKSGLRVIQIPTCSVLYEIQSNNIEGSCFNFNYTKLLVIQECEVVIYENPEVCKKVACFGNINEINEFYQYVGKLISNKPMPYDPKYNSWILEPHHVNILHIYTALRNIEYMQKALEDNIGFFKSRSGYTPLDICLDLNFEAGTELLYRKIKRESRINPMYMGVLENSIKQLCLDRTQKTYKLLNLLFVNSIDSTLRKYSQTEVSLPLIAYTQTIFTDKDSYSGLIPYANEGQPVEFLQTYFKVPMVPGSKKSMDLVEAILESENEKIFMTTFVQTILNEKWIKVRHILWIQAIIYAFYLIFLSIYVITFNIIPLIISFVINTLLILYELRQLGSGWVYFKDVWNYLDLITAVLMTIMFILSIDESKPDSLTSVVLFFSWMRGISYFRILKQTRYYINLILEVVKDILPFLSIVLYSTIAFGLIFQVLLTEQPQPYSTYFAISWEMNIGGFNTESYSGLTYIFFFFHSVLNPLLMLNLLISIMGFTFDKVNGNVQIADSRELASMILEGEQLFHWNRESQVSTYIHICQCIEGEKLEDELTMGMRLVKRRILDISKSQQLVVQNIESLSGKFDALQRAQASTAEEVSEILQEIKRRDYQ